jgi:hypothetical protein
VAFEFDPVTVVRADRRVLAEVSTGSELAISSRASDKAVPPVGATPVCADVANVESHIRRRNSR